MTGLTSVAAVGQFDDADDDGDDFVFYATKQEQAS
jgi:hypothetical protein